MFTAHVFPQPWFEYSVGLQCNGRYRHHHYRLLPALYLHLCTGACTRRNAQAAQTSSTGAVIPDHFVVHMYSAGLYAWEGKNRYNMQLKLNRIFEYFS